MHDTLSILRDLTYAEPKSFSHTTIACDALLIARHFVPFKHNFTSFHFTSDWFMETRSIKIFIIESLSQPIYWVSFWIQSYSYGSELTLLRVLAYEAFYYCYTILMNVGLNTYLRTWLLFRFLFAIRKTSKKFIYGWCHPNSAHPSPLTPLPPYVFIYCDKKLNDIRFILHLLLH